MLAVSQSNWDRTQLFVFDHGGTLRYREVVVYSGSGLRAMGRLLERMGKYREAESYYKKVAERYQKETSLDQFYVRYEKRVGDGRYRAEAAQALKTIFPDGLQRATLADFTTPALPRGHPLSSDPGVQLSQLGLKPGDMILAVDGYRVQSADQYNTVWSFTDAADISLIVWRRGRYLELKGRVRREPFGPRPSAPAVAAA